MCVCICVFADTDGEFAQPHFPFNEIYHNNFHKTTSYRRKSTRNLSNHTQKLDENFPFFCVHIHRKKLPFGRRNMRLWYTQHFYRIHTDRHFHTYTGIFLCIFILFRTFLLHHSSRLGSQHTIKLCFHDFMR